MCKNGIRPINLSVIHRTLKPIVFLVLLPILCACQSTKGVIPVAERPSVSEVRKDSCGYVIRVIADRMLMIMRVIPEDHFKEAERIGELFHSNRDCVRSTSQQSLQEYFGSPISSNEYRTVFCISGPCSADDLALSRTLVLTFDNKGQWVGYEFNYTRAEKNLFSEEQYKLLEGKNYKYPKQGN